MCSETREKKEDASCFDSKEFKGMFEMMEKCCAGKKVTIDMSTIIEAIKKDVCNAPRKEAEKKESCCS